MRRLRALLYGLPDIDSHIQATAPPAPAAAPAGPIRPKHTSTPDQFRRAGGRFVHAPRKAGV